MFRFRGSGIQGFLTQALGSFGGFRGSGLKGCFVVVGSFCYVGVRLEVRI